jgi:hypothetical protein
MTALSRLFIKIRRRLVRAELVSALIVYRHGVLHVIYMPRLRGLIKAIARR